MDASFPHNFQFCNTLSTGKSDKLLGQFAFSSLLTIYKLLDGIYYVSGSGDTKNWCIREGF